MENEANVTPEENTIFTSNGALSVRHGNLSPGNLDFAFCSLERIRRPCRRIQTKKNKDQSDGKSLGNALPLMLILNLRSEHGIGFELSTFLMPISSRILEKKQLNQNCLILSNCTGYCLRRWAS